MGVQLELWALVFIADWLKNDIQIFLRKAFQAKLVTRTA